MALAAGTVWEVRTTGSDTNGGGFVTGASGTDYSQQATAQYALTNGTTNASTTIATVSAAADMVGNIAYVQGGTGSVVAAWYQITAASVGVSITVDRATGLTAGTGVTINIGGALATPGQASANSTVNGQIVYVQNVGADGASIFSVTSASTNVSGGVLSNGTTFFQGYTSTRSLGNTDPRPTIQANVNSATQAALSASAAIQNVIFDSNSKTSSKLTSGGTFVNCLFKGGFNTASTQGTPTVFVACAATANSAAIFVGSALFCEAYANTAAPFSVTIAVHCIASGNTGATTDGFSISASAAQSFTNCISVSNGRDGFRFTATDTGIFANCHAESNAGVGFNLSPSGGKCLINCSAYNNTSGASNGAPSNVGFITPSGSVFTNAAGNVYQLNATANQGALLRAAGFPAVFPRGLTNNYLDVGAAQHQDSGGSSGMLYIPNLEGT